MNVCRVIVVDDDPDVRDSLSLLLQTHQYEVRSALHGRDALDQLLAGYEPNVMLLDLNMPVMNGFEVLGELRKNQAWVHIRIIILSALRNQKELGVHDYLAKPVDVPALLASVATQCSLHAARSLA